MGLFSNFLDKIKPYKPKGELYALIYSCSNSLVKDVPILKREKSSLEGIFIFISFCRYFLIENFFDCEEVLNSLKEEVLDHIKHSTYLHYDRNKNREFVNYRIDLYEIEIEKTFFDNPNNKYVGGVFAYNLFESPLHTGGIERSRDMFKNMAAMGTIAICIKEIGTYLKTTYDGPGRW